ncbi:TAXI family TRAP transporter solute-binding subunit [Natronospirillum operosum]|uniref:TAXI family TRAP transporter solute-binding subunit n=1 Tax=Natronospirillum operosum TaxID=2759953 RepID=A0A4Z0WIT7_9GAMM|nr:TAXI family TRAP transporter solute-binding subunit [Natronospirillum operosum]TGG95055.1 TAXI family TRAP transporter solute-binding subunit [Natronospirillum operosum]
MSIMTKGCLSAALVVAALALPAHALAQTVGVGTMSQGTISYTTGSVISRVMNEDMGLQARVQPSSGETVLIPLLNNGDVDFGIANVLEAYQAYTGTGVFEGRAQENLRVAGVVFPLRTAMFVRADSDIHTLADLEGKRVTMGFSAMGTIDQVMAAVLANAGLERGDIQPVMVPNVVAGAEQLQNGRADAFFFALGGAKPSEVNASVPLRVLPMNNDAESIERMQAIFPDGYIDVAEPLPNYVGMDEPTAVLAYDNLLLTNSTVSEEMMRTVLDGLIAEKDSLVAGLPLFNELTAEDIYKPQLQTPYHQAVIDWANGQ